MTRQEFSKSIKLAAWERSKKHCDECRLPVIGTAEYDHRIPCGLGGTNDLDNCQVLCKKCHRRKTSTLDVPVIAKSVRIEEKRAGVRRQSRPMPGSRKSNFKKRMDGTVEKREPRNE